MFRLPFYIGNFLACFVPGGENRHKVRGWVNIIFYYIPIILFVKRTYGVKIKSVKFVRQITLNRTVCMVNGKYFVKIFRNVSVKKIENYKFLLDFIRNKVPVNIPRIYVAKHIPMYVCERLPGRSIYSFNKQDVIAHESKIFAQTFEVIESLKKIPVDSIVDKERFEFSMQPKRATEKPCKKEVRVFAHFDLNESNLLFDDDFNVISVIDWDSLSMAKNPDTDKNIFLRFWKMYKQS